MSNVTRSGGTIDKEAGVDQIEERGRERVREAERWSAKKKKRKKNP